MAATVADEEKKQLRAILKESRASLPDAAVASASGAIQARLMASTLWRDASAAVLYASHGNEVDTRRLFDASLSSGRAAFFPRLDRDRRAIELVRVRSLAELNSGAFGILEPKGAEKIDPAELAGALVCVPGVAFARDGQRLGRGGGSYDRLLAALSPAAVTVGLCYSFQMLETLPESERDRRLDFVITQFALHASPEFRRHASANQGGTSKWEAL